LKPPGVTSDSWDELNIIAQAELLAYHQIREIEKMEEKVQMIKASVPASLLG
jgi:hypothetical protein